MPALFCRLSCVNCFFCQSSVNPLPTNLKNFRCPHCNCWNRYDASGQIMSDEPAMHDENLNKRSFSRRASPSKDRLPSIYNRGPFCHTCRTNQTLVVQLMSNYLPPPEHPEYAKRVELLPEYRNSLHARYPPVCTNCLPIVEDEIKQKDHMARIQALGGWLKETKGKDKRRQVYETGEEREKLKIEFMAWKIRGCLWAITLMSTWVSYSAGIWNWQMSAFVQMLQPALLVLTLFSLLWTVWDPTYHSLRKAYIQGRDLRVKGKKQYNVLQILAWLSRSITALLLTIPWYYPSWDYLHITSYPSSRLQLYCSISLIFELSVFFASFAVLHIQKPPPIRLLDISSHQPSFARATPESIFRDAHSRSLHTSAAAALSGPDLFSSLSLSSKPVLSPSINPIFGLPSLLSSSTKPINSPQKMDDDGEEADWTSINPSFSLPMKPKKIVIQDEDDGSWLRPQQFFPPEHPTGLETLFANTKLVDEIPFQKTDGLSLAPRKWIVSHARVWWWAGLLPLLVPIYRWYCYQIL
ncbi:hypothetical protein SERLADRAFT_454848 [Serpula lacrymans var. lacrymans S7.9]|uniref:Ima1 N-terminal domain-containing protein n=1 Tax=Serpula lacrymans var. lacrymans (strain S7.9) TaxID=578457 RepID=F8NE11_SERL9|nr:uncharacterized protein SERLADRAFT_454848 [Serpula lacrymans var. lacrymans S7.9]EGO30539.1 hypothetical protein SERLADRAFT_454848 [Serpula lacrymans var. lacrymans S7.9]